MRLRKMNKNLSTSKSSGLEKMVEGMEDDKQFELNSANESDSDVEKSSKKSKSKKQKYDKKVTTLAFELSVVFILFWIAVYYVIVLRYATALPEQLKIQTEHLNHGRFIGERAEQILVKIENLGERVVSSNANEVEAVKLLLEELDKIQEVLNTDVFEMEVDMQQASGAYVHWELVNMYQGLQNIAVKLSRKDCPSDAYFLVNAHFDSKPGSTGSGDDGAMVVAALEVLRVLAISKESFQHPIIFLFNGAEENPLQSSHGFITQHKWAANVKAFLNLESAGSANRDVIFQTGPNHPWLMKYYKQYAAHPHCTTVAEEIFETGLIPSDSDFRIFRDFGNIPGMDMAHTYGGYVYHTKFDKISTIPKGTIQNSGENLLALAKAYANAPELEDPSKYASGQVVFYDVLGKFVVVYGHTQGQKINYTVTAIALVAVVISIIAIGSNSRASQGEVIGEFFITFLWHLVGIALGVGLAVLLAVQLDNFNLTLTWFTNKWMVVGLYFCPTIFGLGLPTAMYISSARKDRINVSYRIQLVLNSHLVVMAVLTGVVTYLGYRSAYMLMISALFYTVTLLFNTFTTLYKRNLKWVFAAIIVQVLPFVYYTYLSYFMYFTIMPMMARIGDLKNPDLYIGGISVIITLLSLGFVIPLLNLFRQPKTILSLFIMAAAIFVGISASPYGFPFRAETNVERFNWLHVRRVFHGENDTVIKADSGFYFDPQDKRGFTTLEGTIDTTKIVPMEDKCYEEMYCGLPVFNHRWNRAKEQAYWLPSDDAELPGDVPELRLISKEIDTNATSVRFDFELDGPPHMGIYFGPLDGVQIVEWSFIDDMLVENWDPPYFIFFSKANDQSTLAFHVVLEKQVGDLDVPVLQLAVGGHFLSAEHERSHQLLSFKQSFPSFAYIMEWPSSYESWYF